MYERKKITEDELEEVFEKAAKLIIAKKKLKGIPVAGYDPKRKLPFVEYPDGTKEYAKA
ncbi:MAG: hypothetical protein K6B52_04440 [Clostridiales bacterium]|nr:hypothetical protein [Clostridiales bacterium]